MALERFTRSSIKSRKVVNCEKTSILLSGSSFEMRSRTSIKSSSLVDLGTTVRFSLFDTDASFRLNVNNLFDTVYIAESNSNIHAADDATEDQLWNGVDKRNFVWFGFGRTWNASLRFNF